MRLEIQLIFLFLLSVGAMIFHHTVPRTMLVDFRSDQWKTGSIASGNGTHSAQSVTDRGIETTFSMKDGHIDSVCAAVFERNNENPVFDISWLDKVSLTAWIEGDDHGFFRFFLRNRIPGVYDDQDVVSRQYNEVAFKITNEKSEYTFEKDHFHVPSWWAESYGKQFEHSLPSFDKVDMIEVTTGSSVKNANVKLIIQQIRLQGYWISPLVLYRTLLTTWLVLAGGMMFQTLLKTKHELENSNKREIQLRQINQSLTNKTNELSQLAHHDGLTGLMNRLGILQYDDLAREAVRQGHDVSLIVIDVDNFKLINDTRGHNVGDKILAGIGDLLSEQWTGIELFARWGGEEFIVICFNKTELECSEFANEIRVQIESKLNITCSFGVYQINSDQPFAESVDRADKAMYVAKSQGKNRVVCFSEVTGKHSLRNPAELSQTS